MQIPYPPPVNSIPFVTTKSLVRQSHLSECDGERGQDTDNQIKERRDTRLFASLGGGTLWIYVVGCRIHREGGQ